MNLYHLKTFYTVARLGSLTRAAELLCITQPAVTKQIQNLQGHYDLRLFNQVGKRMVLTDAGEALCRVAENIFQLEKQAEETIRDFQHQSSGRLRILSSESFGAYYLPNILVRFSRLHPKICISVDVLPNEEVVEQTAGFNNDLGFVSDRVEHPRIICREILEDSLILIVAPAHPMAGRDRLQPQDLQHQPFIMHEVGSSSRGIVDSLIQRYDLGIEARYELSSNESIKRMVESGLGIALVSRSVVEGELADGRLKTVPLDDGGLQRKFYMIHHREKYFSRTLQSFIEATRQFCAEASGGKAKP